MLVVRGRYRGAVVTPRAFRDDWVLTVEFPLFPFAPTMLRLESERERLFFAEADHPGTFWREWRLEPDGTFASLRTRSARRAYDRTVRRARTRRGAG